MTNKEKIKLDKILCTLAYFEFHNKNLTQQQYYYISTALEELKSLLNKE